MLDTLLSVCVCEATAIEIHLLKYSGTFLSGLKYRPWMKSFHHKVYLYRHQQINAFLAFVGVKTMMSMYIFLQHPQIQKKSQYIKYLCCDDVRTLHQWINGIRIAKVTPSQPYTVVMSSCHHLLKTIYSYLAKYIVNLTSLCLTILNMNCKILHFSFFIKIIRLCYHNSIIGVFLLVSATPLSHGTVLTYIVD